MELTEEQAIDRTRELWTWLAETGKGKYGWPQWSWNGGIYARTPSLCFLCEFDNYHGCEHCPYYKEYDITCHNVGEPFVEWFNAKTPRTRKKYAKEFLAKIVALKEAK